MTSEWILSLCSWTHKNIIDIFQGHGTDPHGWTILHRSSAKQVFPYLKSNFKFDDSTFSSSFHSKCQCPGSGNGQVDQKDKIFIKRSGSWRLGFICTFIHSSYIYITLGVSYFRMESALTFSLVACCFFVVASDNPPFFGDCELFLSIFVSIIYLSFSGYYSLL